MSGLPFDLEGDEVRFVSGSSIGVPIPVGGDINGEILRLLATQRIRPEELRLVRGGAFVDASSFTYEVRRSTGPYTAIDPLSVRSAMAEGATLAIDRFQTYHSEVARLCNSLALSLGVPTQCNVYCTPSGGGGFAWHADSHNVLILQVEGSKDWSTATRLPAERLPTPSCCAEVEEVCGVEEVTLSPGDLLYLPRGVPHRAVAGSDAPSTHLTVGIHRLPRADLLVRAIRRMERWGLLRDDAGKQRPSDMAPGGVDLQNALDFEATLALVRSMSVLPNFDMAEVSGPPGAIRLAVPAVGLEPAGSSDVNVRVARTELPFHGPHGEFIRQLMSHLSQGPVDTAELTGWNDIAEDVVLDLLDLGIVRKED
ncbi:JmjC domain-containing protein [Aquihabitans daechungensis]|uniref:JmjC domain-containing protein n=1 Tax=Aquihabitans daechungensis TaxID=1052257 RepID=UPI003B9F81F7